jgi:hypothetical protein
MSQSPHCRDLVVSFVLSSSLQTIGEMQDSHDSNEHFAKPLEIL